MDGYVNARDQFLALAEEYNELGCREIELVERCKVLMRRIDRETDESGLKRFHRRQLERVSPGLDLVKTKKDAILAKVEALQKEHAEVPHAVDELDAGLPSLRLGLHDVREHIERLKSLTPSSIVGASASREQRVREFEEEARGYVEKIRRREAALMATLAGEEQVRG